MKLVQELLILTCLLLFSVLALLINLSFFSETSSNEALTQKKSVTKASQKTIQNQLGKQLFKNNCAACHNRNMRDGLVGPALGGVEKRWENNDVSIQDFIQNSEAVIKNGNSYAKNLYEKWSPTRMPSFQNLKEEEIEAILNYIEEVYAP